MHLTHLDKIFFPEAGYTKGDVVAYYQAIAPWMLPHLAGRPVALERYPDGILGEHFFQKNAPAWMPEWIPRVRIPSERSGRAVDYLVVDSEEALLYLVNLGTLTFHVWASRAESLTRPDWALLDLDPRGAPFDWVVRIARAARRLCREVGLEAVVKTSGKTGLHVLVPLGAQLEYPAAGRLAEYLARILAARLPEIATVERALSARHGRVYIDRHQAAVAQVVAAPLTLRAVPTATVSMPLRWRELGPRLDPTRYDLKRAVRRMRRLRSDPLRPLLEAAPDVHAALRRLEVLASAAGSL